MASVDGFEMIDEFVSGFAEYPSENQYEDKTKVRALGRWVGSNTPSWDDGREYFSKKREIERKYSRGESVAYSDYLKLGEHGAKALLGGVIRVKKRN